jgi:hypothetical protein
MKTNIKQYASGIDRRSVFHNVPMQYRNELVRAFNSVHIPVRIKYRGPRNTPADSGRSIIARQGTCLKQNAKSFALYIRF